MLIIGFGHKSGVGKDTAALAIQRHIEGTGRECIIRHIAYGLKGWAHHLYANFGLECASYYDVHRKARTEPISSVHPVTPVELWCRVGQLMRDQSGDDAYWLKQLFQWTDLTQPEQVLLIPDVRTLAEVVVMEDIQAKLVRVDRPHAPHVPEAVLDDELSRFADWDAALLNDGTIGQLNATAVEMWLKLEGEQ